ncbi:MAG: hypothetical protein LPK02_07130 [Rhodobacterales bacterium]|nr:hypothetical protein [Rhodobacterales bacterium]
MLEDPGGLVKDMLRPLKQWAERHWLDLNSSAQAQFNQIEETLRDDILEIMELESPDLLKGDIQKLLDTVDAKQMTIDKQRDHIANLERQAREWEAHVAQLEEQIELHEIAQLEAKRESMGGGSW